VLRFECLLQGLNPYFRQVERAATVGHRGDIAAAEVNGEFKAVGFKETLFIFWGSVISLSEAGHHLLIGLGEEVDDLVRFVGAVGLARLQGKEFMNFAGWPARRV